MPKVSVYLSDAMYQRVQARGMSVSALAQRAIEEELARESVREWAERQRARPPRRRATVDTAALLEDVRAEFGR